MLTLIKDQPGDNMALQTYSFIQSQITHQARIDAIETILHCADAKVESLGEVVLEAWSLLKTKHIWGIYISMRHKQWKLAQPRP